MTILLEDAFTKKDLKSLMANSQKAQDAAARSVAQGATNTAAGAATSASSSTGAKNNNNPKN